MQMPSPQDAPAFRGFIWPSFSFRGLWDIDFPVCDDSLADYCYRGRVNEAY